MEIRSILLFGFGRGGNMVGKGSNWGQRRKAARWMQNIASRENIVE